MQIAIQFPSVFWDSRADVFGYVNEEEDRRGEFFMFWNMKRVCGLDALIALVAGKSAHELETVRNSHFVRQYSYDYSSLPANR